MEILFAYPSWFILLCLLAGVVAAGIVYFRSSALTETSRGLRILLPVLRGTAVFILVFLLLEPLIKRENRHTEKPILAIVHDNSQSIRLSADSAYYQQAFRTDFEKSLEQLRDKYEVHTYSLGETTHDSLQFKYDEKVTDISAALEKIHTAFFNRNLGAVVLSTDGIYNRGISPVSMINRFELVPFYTIGLGDTTRMRDTRIATVLYNPTAYLGNEFPVEATVAAVQMKGEKLKVTLARDGKEIESREITIPSENYSLAIPFILSADKPGIFRYQVSVDPVKNELTTRNNRQDAIIRVVENKQKILVVANSPHPDIAALRQSLELSQQYETESVMAAEYKGNTEGYALLILHQVPSESQSGLNIYQDAVKRNIPVWFILGPQTSVAGINSMKAGIVIQQNRPGSTNQAQPGLNNSFSLFTLDDGLKANISRWPPLNTPFGEYKTSPGADILFHQQVGNISTQAPLMFFTRHENIRCGFTCGEGIWRWRMKNVEVNGNADLFDNLIRKCAQYLVSSGNRSRFRILHKPAFTESEPVLFDGELYNETFEPVNDPDVEISIESTEGKDYKYVFSRSGKGYRLDAGRLSPGIYKYTAQTTLGGKKLMAQGEFSVNMLNQELASLTADHKMLFKLSKQTNGKFYSPHKLTELVKDLNARKDITPTIYTQKELTDLVHEKWLFFVAVLLLSAEWFIRKLNGKY